MPHCTALHCTPPVPHAPIVPPCSHSPDCRQQVQPAGGSPVAAAQLHTARAPIPPPSPHTHIFWPPFPHCLQAAQRMHTAAHQLASSWGCGSAERLRSHSKKMRAPTTAARLSTTLGEQGGRWWRMLHCLPLTAGSSMANAVALLVLPNLVPSLPGASYPFDT